MCYEFCKLLWRAHQQICRANLIFQVNESARPDMGPNLYITPTGSFTQFHQDGKIFVSKSVDEKYEI